MSCFDFRAAKLGLFSLEVVRCTIGSNSIQTSEQKRWCGFDIDVVLSSKFLKAFVVCFHQNWRQIGLITAIDKRIILEESPSQFSRSQITVSKNAVRCYAPSRTGKEPCQLLYIANYKAREFAFMEAAIDRSERLIKATSNQIVTEVFEFTVPEVPRVVDLVQAVEALMVEINIRGFNLLIWDLYNRSKFNTHFYWICFENRIGKCEAGTPSKKSGRIELCALSKNSSNLRLTSYAFVPPTAVSTGNVAVGVDDLVSNKIERISRILGIFSGSDCLQHRQRHEFVSPFGLLQQLICFFEQQSEFDFVLAIVCSFGLLSLLRCNHAAPQYRKESGRSRKEDKKGCDGSRALVKVCPSKREDIEKSDQVANKCNNYHEQSDFFPITLTHFSSIFSKMKCPPPSWRNVLLSKKAPVDSRVFHLCLSRVHGHKPSTALKIALPP